MAAPHIGFSKLLHVPSSVRYGDLMQRCGGMAQRMLLDICFGYDGPAAIKLLQMHIIFAVNIIHIYVLDIILMID